MPADRPDAALAASYNHCRHVARIAAKNFFYGFLLLPSAKRNALCALYAFMRGVDDIADEPGPVEAKRKGLAGQRAQLDRALAGEDCPGPVWPALCDTVRRFSIPSRYLHDLISGAEMDQTVCSYETFDQLRDYCYRVAGTVGLTCLYVFGFQDPRAPELAEKLGIAFQLTNVLRDVAGDRQMGRVYLPQEDLRRFGCEEDAPRAGRITPEWRALMKFEVERAWDFYSQGWPLLEMVDRDSRAALWALARIYTGILERIEARDFDVFAAPVPRLSTAEKLWILARARMGWRGEVNALRIRDRDGRRAGGALVRPRAG